MAAVATRFAPVVWAASSALLIVGNRNHIPIVQFLVPVDPEVAQAKLDPKIGSSHMLGGLGIKPPVKVIVYTACLSCTADGGRPLITSFRDNSAIHVIGAVDPQPYIDLSKEAAQTRIVVVDPKKLVGWNAYKTPRSYTFGPTGALEVIE